jgi:hypothetical protein
MNVVGSRTDNLLGRLETLMADMYCTLLTYSRSIIKLFGFILTTILLDIIYYCYSLSPREVRAYDSHVAGGGGAGI